MFLPFLTLLREGLEATLLVSLFASYFRRSDNAQWFPLLWTVVLLALVCSLSIGILSNTAQKPLAPHNVALFEGAVALLAMLMLSILTLRSTQYGQTGFSLALLFTVFLAVMREGLSAVHYLTYIFTVNSSNAAAAGAVFGLALALLGGVVLYLLGGWLSERRFTRVADVLQMLIAAGSASGMVRAFAHAGWWPYWQDIVFDLTRLIPKDSVLAAVLAGSLGLQACASLSEAAAYLFYLLAVLTCLWLRRPKQAA
ncbi:FTR1 family protein [Pantoea sp. A4]|uniref:FTR1 family protein n=1 Tax=Pantoea sp. A4 TaxID=1225184 RepID=UPI000379AF72|nr:FTR1 family protein [Pantoea sp. A4]